MRWLITETCEYRVDADTRKAAEEIFLEHGPGDVEEPVAFIGSIERTIEEAPPVAAPPAWPARSSPFGASASGGER